MALIGVAIGVLWIALIGGVIAWMGLHLRARSIRRHNYPFRDLPWYLGGTPDLPLEPPGGDRGRRKRRDRS